ncbi:phasin family protein [Methylonatrum kenyense]|uniref:phasin family protein n=1 Tax=Methylonatrum kenyense TaxID=455253 RepID=UPI0020C0C8B4|nr:phasin family protein [Methylonatrum kenyense]MCK8516058.1 phasin family protein [Methylonatrum kenyense]
MSTDVNKMFEQQLEQLTGPARKFAELALDHAQKVSAFQTEVARDYILMGVGYAKEAAAIDSPQSLQKWLGGRGDAVQTVGKRVGDDVQTLLGFGRDYAEQTSKLSREQIETVSKAIDRAA